VSADRATVLVVDDAAASVRLLAAILSSQGYDVLTACGGGEALEQIAAHRVDIVLLDVQMPDVNGYDVCRSLREDASTAMLPVVMLTAGSGE